MNNIYNINFNMTIASMQEFLEKNYKLLGFSLKIKNLIIKNLQKTYINREMRDVLYNYCINKLNNNCRKQGSHITYEERLIIEVFHMLNFRKAFISKFLGVNRSTITREINLNKYEEVVITTRSARKHSGNDIKEIYDARIAEKNRLKKKENSKRKYKLDKNSALRDAIVALLKNGDAVKDGVRYSPSAIEALSKEGKIFGIKETISDSTIYKMVHKKKYGLNITDLPFKRKYYKRDNKYTETYITPERKKEHSIDVMPIEAKEKTSKFFWEGDSIIGKRQGSNNTAITLVNVYSKFLIIERAKNKTAESFVEVLNKIENEISPFKDILKLLLLDNGVEFSNIEGIMDSSVELDTKRLLVYYAHAYASYERGLNENTNGLVRRDLIKGSMIENYTDEEILNIAKRLNNMPRKSLGWKTALEVMEELLIENQLKTDWLEKYRIKKCKYLVA